MPSIVICDCGARFQAADSLAGRMVGCPTCGASLAVPMPSDPGPSRQQAASDGWRVRCDVCGEGFAAAANLAGRRVPCTRCGAQIEVAGREQPPWAGLDDPLFGESLPRDDAASRVLTRTAIPPSPKRPVRKERRADQSASSDSRQAGLWSGVGLMVLGVAITAWAAATSDGSLGSDQYLGIGITGIVLGGILAAFFALGGRKR
jgi:DNA-directed RNA polymerase subunit RPC12/RpoP